jgi:DNA-binding MarR family transcriptional regulator
MTELGGEKYAAIQRRQVAWINELATGLKRSELETTARVLHQLSSKLDTSEEG